MEDRSGWLLGIMNWVKLLQELGQLVHILVKLDFWHTMRYIVCDYFCVIVNELFYYGVLPSLFKQTYSLNSTISN
jgi:Mg2+/citrate symporter